MCIRDRYQRRVHGENHFLVSRKMRVQITGACLVMFLVLLHQTLAYETFAIYRWYHPHIHDHFYTISQAENAGRHGYNFEGIGFYTLKRQEAGSVPIHRILRSTGDHFYTTNGIEASSVGGSREGIIGYAYTSQVAGSVPLYRYFCPKCRVGDHFYTIYPHLEKLNGYNLEGIIGSVSYTHLTLPTIYSV
eukprot:TRINITY_DN110_c0_g1_i8.p1 TRINITY_DN110_c0_g1~~TRINITY_DN110_c0_g1_i8.p1  ORF type:complete len:190 (-),score=35.08 TRINITY_DN110_c0_g1_i8:35-604(-)